MLMSIEMMDTGNNKLYRNINTLLTKYTKLEVFSLISLKRSWTMFSRWTSILSKEVIRITGSESIVLHDDVVDICKLL